MDWYIPMCYFPSTVFLVDDSVDFAKNLSTNLSFESDTVIPRIFDNPYAALSELAYINREMNNHDESEGYFQESESAHASNPETTTTIEIDLSSIHLECKNPNRFSEVSVVVVDFSMPSMNGRDFLKALSGIGEFSDKSDYYNPAVKRIMLTGEADDELATEMFNQQLLQGFYKKNSSDMLGELIPKIKSLQEEYFKDMSHAIMDALAINKESLQAVRDAKFAAFFHELCRKHEIVEYYLMDNSGSFLLLNKSGEMKSLLVKQQLDWYDYAALAKDNGASEADIAKIQSGKVVPCFSRSRDVFTQEWSDWSQLLYPAELLQGDGEMVYAYALIDGGMPFDIPKGFAPSFESYIELLSEQRDRQSA